MRRLRLFVDAYGPADWPALIPTARMFVEHVAKFVKIEADKGDPGMQRLVEQGVHRMTKIDVPWLDEYRDALERAL